MTSSKSINRGVLQGLATIGVATIGIGLALDTVTAASAGLFANLAFIGSILLLGYIIEALWLTPKIRFGGDSGEWLGFMAGVGLAAVVSIPLSLLLAEYRAAGNESLLNSIGIAWIGISFLILGLMLVIQPLLAARGGASDAPPEPVGSSTAGDDR